MEPARRRGMSGYEARCVAGTGAWVDELTSVTGSEGSGSHTPRQPRGENRCLGWDVTGSAGLGSDAPR
jgi:hypothetical protein